MDFLQLKKFTMHSGEEAWFKIECDALTDGEIAAFAEIIAQKVGMFSRVHGIPKGGLPGEV